MASQPLATRILQPEHNVARYCRPRWFVKGIVSRDAFLLRGGELFLSTNWLEHFHESDRRIQVSGMLSALASKNFNVSPNGTFAILNVGAASQGVRQFQSRRLLFQLLGQAHDPSHTGIFGYGSTNIDSKGNDIRQSLASSVQEAYPAIQ